MSALFRTASKSRLSLLVCSIILVAGCSGGSTGTSSDAVHGCPIAPGFTSPKPITIPSVTSSTYGVTLPANASLYGIENASNNGYVPYFFIGPSGASCSAIYGGDGSQNMTATDKSDNATIFEELAPPGMSVGYGEACSAFPDLASLIMEDTGQSCLTTENLTTGKSITSDLTLGLAPDNTKVSLAQGAHVSLSKILPGDAPHNLAIFLGASSRFTTWQLSVLDLWTDNSQPQNPVPGFFIRSIACAAPQGDAVLCTASFDYFLAETAKTDGLALPSQSAIDGLIRDQIQS